MLTMILNTIRGDLTSHITAAQSSSSTSDASACLALCSIANVSGLELIQALHVEVQQVLISQNSTAFAKKKSALCLLRLIRTMPGLISGSQFAPHVANLLQDRHLGVLTSVMSLLIGLSAQNESEYQSLIPYVVHILGMLVLKKACAREYLYYRTPSPWLQIKLLKFLQLFPNAIVPEGPGGSNKQYVSQLQSIISKILTETDVSDSINKSNADHAILFEAVNLIVIWGSAGPSQLRDGAMRLLGKFISVREPNIRYLGLMTMSRLAQLEGSNDSVKKHQATVLVSLKDADISVRRRALDLLFVMCDTDNAERIVDELVGHLAVADVAIREEMVLKIAILAEKYATDLRWYVDTIIKLISIAGDFVSDSIWHRVVQIVTNHPQGDLQSYAAATLLVTISPRRPIHETALRVAAYVLGEFGFLIAERPGMSGEDQFRLMHQHFGTANEVTKSILITTYAKLANLYEECRHLALGVFLHHGNHVNVEIQQRCLEYRNMREAFSPEGVEDLLREMPPWDGREVSGLEKRLQEKEDAVANACGVTPIGNVSKKDNNSWSSTQQNPTNGEENISNGVQGEQVGSVGNLGSVDEEDEEDEAKVVEEENNDDSVVEEGVEDEDDEETDVSFSVDSHAHNTQIHEGNDELSRDVETDREDLDDVGDGDETDGPAFSIQGIPREVIPAMRKAFSNLCTSPSGVLFENHLLQIGVKHEYQGSKGRVSIFFGNVGSQQLYNFRCQVEECDHLLSQMQGTPGLLESNGENEDTDSGGCTVAVRTQAKLLLLVEVTAPFDDAPAMRITFETRPNEGEKGEIVKHEYPLRLPIVATCFMEPVTLEPGAFMQRWQSLDGQDRECQEVVRAPPNPEENGPTINEESMLRIAHIVTEGLKFGRCQGCDPTPWTVSGAATFRTGAKDLNGNNINVGCLVRVEANADAGVYRVTTRTLHPICSKAVKNVALVSIKLA